MPVTPLSTVDIVQSNSGISASATSVSVSLPAGTTSGNTVIIIVVADQEFTTPSGFTLDVPAAGATSLIRYYRKQPVGAGEGPWTVSLSGTPTATSISWRVVEVARLLSTANHRYGFDDTTYTGTDTTIGTLLSTQNGVTGFWNDALLLGVYAFHTTTNPSGLSSFAVAPDPPGAQTTAAHTVAAELGWGVDTVAGGWHYTQFQQAFPYPLHPPLSGVNAYSSTVTGKTNNSGDLWTSFVVQYVSLESGVTDPLVHADGFEYGITPNTAAPTTSTRLLDILNGTWGTQVAVISTAPRSGTYHLEVNQTGQAGRVGWDTNTLGTSKDDAVWSFGFRPVSATGTVVVAEIAPASGTILQLVWNSSTTQLGLRWGSGGTISYQQGTTPTGAYVWVDLLADGFTGTTRTARWFVNSQEEDGPADLTGQTASSLLSTTFGLNAVQTARFYVDDSCKSVLAGDFPLGPHNVRLLTVDPAATPTGNLTTNFNTFSANGTLAAYAATTARNAIDEVPPTISASADGLVQVTANTNAWVKFEMGTYTLAAGERIDYVGLVAALWANSAQSATLEFWGETGNEPVTIFLSASTSFSPGNAAQPASSTVPMWVRGKWPRSYNWSQSALNLATIDVGRSSDATPDIGIHVLYLQVAVAQTRVARIYGPDEDGMTVDVTQASLNDAAQTYFVDTGPTRGATLRYVQRGAEVVKVIAANDTLTETVGAYEFDEVARVTIEPDPLP